LQIGDKRLPIVEQSQELQDIRIELIRQSIMQVDGSPLLVEREFAVIIGEGPLSHNEIAELRLLCIARTDSSHDSDPRLALFQNM
jgi:hypothetical protein